MKLNQVTLPAINMTESVEFYKKLGFELIVDSIPRYCRFVCPGDQSTLSLHGVKELAEGEGVVIYFEEEKLDDYISDLQSRGVSIEMMPKDQEWLWREAWLRDPSGNKIIIYHAGENRVNPPWRI